MTELRFVNNMTVELVRSMGDDKSIIQAAQVSVVGGNDGEGAKDPERFLSYLMRWRHGSPFESTAMTFRIQVPIAIAREWMRHRIGWSYNEVSGRYKVLEPVFYVPDHDRPLVNVGTSAKPELAAGDGTQEAVMLVNLNSTYGYAWSAYESMIHAGIANEVARFALPVGTMTEFYATCNARSLMAFLALRTSDAGMSHPQYEIEEAAHMLEKEFANLFPATYAAFVKHGRVAP